MILTIQKKTIWMVLGLVFATTLIVTLAGVSVAVSSNPVDTGKTVVIDAGHGGRDGGVTGVATGIKESDINLAIAKSLRHFLEGKGYRVVMTRSTTDGLYGMAKSNRKMLDMQARKTTILDNSPDFVVSIHQNSFSSPLPQGPQVFYAPSSESGKESAAVMQKILNASLDSDRVPKAGDYYILQCSEYPSLLVECGFLSNPDEEKLLISAVYQEKVAYSIFTAIHAILSPPEVCNP